MAVTYGLRNRGAWRRALRVRRGEIAGAATASVRGRLLTIATLAMTPVVIFASAVSLQQAYGARGYLHAAAWMASATVPLLAGAAAILIISITAETLIVRWLVYLERLTLAYSRGRYSLRPRRLKNAPAEFQRLGLAVSEMAAAVEDRDSALRSAIDEQSVLLREIHHRVKNNLQIIGSLLSLQASHSREPSVKQALTEALVRIDTMALSQRFMQPAEADDHVSSSELLEAFVRQVKARLGGGPRRLHLQVLGDERILDLDQGARLVLIAAEVLIQAYGQPLNAPLSCLITLKADGDALALSIVALGQPEAFRPVEGSISDGIIEGYVRQLRGEKDTLVRRTPASSDAVLTVRFPVS